MHVFLLGYQSMSLHNVNLELGNVSLNYVFDIMDQIWEILCESCGRAPLEGVDTNQDKQVACVYPAVIYNWINPQNKKTYRTARQVN